MKKILLTALLLCTIVGGVMAQSGATMTDVRVNLCEGEKYQIRDRQIDSSGVYYDTLLVDGQGNDSIVRYIVNFHPTYNIYDTMQICQGDSVYFCNGYVKDEGDYECHYLTTVYGCDSIRHLHLIVNPNIVSVIDTTTCEPGFYFYNQYYTTAGVYDHVVKMQNTCDEIHRLILHFDSAKHTDVYVEVCEGGTYIVGEDTIAAKGIYIDTMFTSHGCDSVIRYIFNVKYNNFHQYDTATICQGESYQYHEKSYTTAGDHERRYTSVHGCDSIYHLHLTVNDNYHIAVYDTICSNERLLINGQQVTADGVYAQVFKSVTGCDSIVDRHITIKQATYRDVSLDVCEGDSFSLRGKMIPATGIYYDTLVNKAGCDSVVRYIFNVHPSYDIYETETICEGDSVLFYGQWVKVAGDYTHKETSVVSGCDSIHHLHLTVNQRYLIVGDTSYCGTSFQFFDQTLTESGTYEKVFQTVNGCDSIFRLNLTLNQSVTVDIPYNACEGDSVMINNVKIAATGIYVDHKKTLSGCDSIVRYIFNVHNRFEKYENATICEGDSVLFQGKYRSVAGDYTEVYKTANGCDSTYHLHLTVKTSYLTEGYDTVCASSYQFFERTLTESGVYDKVFKSVDGCDSTYRIHLTLHKPVTVEIPYDACFGDSVIINNIKIPATGIYEDHQLTKYGCDSTVRYIFNVHNSFEQFTNESICEGDTLDFHGERFAAAGDYSVNFKTAHGCDSIYHLHLTVKRSYLTEGYDTTCANSYQFFNQTLTESGTYDQVFGTVDGCDSIFRLHLTLYKPVTVDVPWDACYGDSAYINGKHIPAKGVYVDSMFTTHGCDSIVRYVFNVHNRFEQYDTAAICQGESYNFHGQMDSLAGDYVQYFQTVNGCDSVYHLHLTVYDNHHTIKEKTICQNDSFVINGQHIVTSGTYYENYKTTHGCDSVIEWHITVNYPTYRTQTIEVCQGETYDIRGKKIPAMGVYNDTMVNAAGCDSVVQYIFNVHPTYDIHDTVTICDGDSVLFCGDYVTTPGDYTKQYQSVANGCDSVHHLHLTVNRSYLFETDTTVCALVYKFFNQNLTESGVYEQKFKTTSGCDSVYRINLKIYHPVQVDIPYDACYGDSALINGVKIAATGIYTMNFKTSHGCDSVVRYIFNVHNRFEKYDSAVICQGDSFLFQGTYISAAGDYTKSYQTAPGCDSTYHLHLTVNPSYLFTRDTTICSNTQFYINGQPVQTSGTYYEHYHTSLSCDSTIEWHITVNYPTFRTQTIEVCQGETYDLRGKKIPAMGDYYDTLRNSKGCDSIVHYIFNVHPTYDLYDTATICEGDSVLFCGDYVTAAGDYTKQYQAVVNGCDSVRHLHLNVNRSYLFERDTTFCGYSFAFFNQNLTKTGTYDQVFQTKEGCDSIYRIHLTLKNHTFSTRTFEACQGETFEFRGMTISKTSVFYDTLVNAAGCDSIVEYRYNIHPSYDIYDTLRICEGDSAEYCGEQFKVAGDYTRNFHTVHGCDSVRHLHLIVNPTYHFVIDTAVCGTDFYFHNHHLTDSGTYIYNHLTVNGCDSVYEIHLKLYKPVTVDVPYDACDGDSAYINGVWVPATGVYTVKMLTTHGCDSIVNYIFNKHQRFEQFDTLTICQGDTLPYQGEDLTDGGDYVWNYRTIHNCESIYHLHLTVNPTYKFVTDTVVCGTEFYFHNQSLTETGTYRFNHHTVAGCDSIYIINLTLYKPVTVDINYEACDGDSAYINGKHVPAKGVYIDSLLTTHGCDSIVRHIFNVHPRYEQYVTASICEGSSYTFHGKTYNLTGDYVEALQTIHGCDSIFHLHLTVNSNYHTVKDTTICVNDGFAINGQQILTTGTYYQGFHTTLGCDSVIEWHVKVNNPSYRDTAINVCTGETFVIRGKEILATGVHYDTLVNSVGCDSVVRYIFNEIPTYDTYDTIIICDGDTAQFYGESYTIAGDYTQVTKSGISNCSSTLHLHLIVNRSYTFDTAVVACGYVYDFQGLSLTSSGRYQKRYKTKAGCDSIYNITLTLYQPAVTDIQYEACDGDSAYINGRKVLASGVYIDSLRTSHGCDSIVRHIFNVHHRYEQFDTANICEGETYVFHGNAYTAGGDYHANFKTQHQCDSIFHLHLNVHSTYKFVTDTTICGTEFHFHNHTLTKSCTDTVHYKSIHGCDSIYIVNLKLHKPVFVSVPYESCDGDSAYINGRKILASGTYNDTMKTKYGCDSIVQYVFDIQPRYEQYDTAHICDGESFDFHGQAATAAGDYNAYLKTVHGCDSIFHLHLYVHNNYYYKIDTTICSNHPFFLKGQQIDSTGRYIVNYHTIHGCDSIFEFNVTVVPVTIIPTEAAICQGDTYRFRNHDYTKSGVYDDTLYNHSGCDVIYRLVLDVHPTYHIVEADHEICQTELPLIWQGKPVTTSGVYNAYYYTVHGCDSIITTNFVVHESEHNYETIIDCSGEPYQWEDTIITTPGDYTRQYYTIYGCDSIRHLHYDTVPPTVTIDETICEGDYYDFRGHKYYLEGSYKLLYPGPMCDTIYTINLSVDTANRVTEKYFDLCNQTMLDYGGKIYTESGIYYDTTRTAAGCLKITKLHINLGKDTVINQFFNICEGTTATFRGHTYTTSGVYHDTAYTAAGCKIAYIIVVNINPLVTLDYETMHVCMPDDSVMFDGVYYKPGTYFFASNTSVAPCDPHHRLTVVSDYFFHDTTVTMCFYNLPYVNPYTHKTYNAPGVYFENYTTQYLGCDSIYRIDLRVNYSERRIVYDTVYNCSGSSYVWQDTILNSNGDYTAVLTSSTGCDSIIHLHYEQNQPPIRYIDKTLCDGDYFDFRGRRFNSTGSHVLNCAGPLGCDTTYVIDITVDTTASYREVTHYDCSKTRYVFQGQTYTKSGVYFDTTYNTNGCLQVTKLMLTLGRDTIDTTFVICESGSLTFRGKTYTQTGTYRDTLISPGGCPEYYKIHVNVLPAYQFTDTLYVCGSQKAYYHRTGKWYGAGVYNFYEHNGVDSCPDRYHLEVIDHTAYHDTTVIICHDALPYVHPHTHKSYNAHGIYHDTLYNSGPINCPTYYTLTLNVVDDHQAQHRYDTIYDCSGVPFNWQDTILNTTGDFVRTYVDRYHCDSVIHLHYVTQGPTFPITRTICYGDYVDFRGRRFSTAGTYSFTVPATTMGSGLHQCDTTFNMTIVVDSSGYYHRIDTTVCTGFYAFNGRRYTKTGVYYDTLYSNSGCLQITELDLKIGKDTTINTTDTICDGATYTFFNTTLTTTGTYCYPVLTNLGCTETHCVHLTVLPVVHIDTTDYVCGPNETIQFKGNSYGPGVYTFSDPYDTARCPQVYTLTVIDESTSNSSTVEICSDALPYIDPYTHKSYYKSDTIHDTYMSQHGCPIPYTLYLTVNKLAENNIYDTICSSNTPYRWHGMLLYNDVDTQYIMPRGNLCDSVDYLHLKIVDAVTDIYDTICQGQIYEWYGGNYTIGGVYKHNCGTYHGCTVIEVLHLTVTPPVDVISVSAENVCDANGGMEISVNVKFATGSSIPTYYEVLFDAAGHVQGLNDVKDVFTGSPITINYGYNPQDTFQYVRPDNYNLTVQFDNGACDQHRSTSYTTVEMKYPAYVLDENWHDVVAVLRRNHQDFVNGFDDNYEFDWFQWYDNGASVSSGTLSYYYRQGADLTGHQISARLTRKGENYGCMTCPLTFVPEADLQNYPTIIPPANNLPMRAPYTYFTAEEGGEYFLYTLTGQLIHSATFDADEKVNVTLPTVQTYYILRVVTPSIHETYKILVH